MTGAILVTGGSGFVGMAIAEALIKCGHKVVLFDMATSPFANRLVSDRLQYVYGDLLDASALEGVALMGVTQIVHGAAVTPPESVSAAEARRVADINVNAASVVAEFALAQGIARICHLSSVSVYGPARTDRDGCFDETASQPQPDTLYGQTKLKAERVLCAAAPGDDLRITNLRLGPVFGPWEAPGNSRTVTSPHHQCLEDALAGRITTLPRTLNGDWLYSLELARILAELLAMRSLPRTLNLGSGVMTTLPDWCAALQQIVPGYRWQMDPDAPGIVIRHRHDRPALSTRKLSRIIGQRQRVDLVQAAKDWAAFQTAFTSTQDIVT